MAVPVLALTVAVLAQRLPDDDFNAAEWRAVERSDDFTRLEMVDSLIWSGQLDGMTRSEVVLLLGPDCECAYFSDWDLVYWLGPERSFLPGLDSEWLIFVIRFDANGRTSEYSLATD